MIKKHPFYNILAILFFTVLLPSCRSDRQDPPVYTDDTQYTETVTAAPESESITEAVTAADNTAAPAEAETEQETTTAETTEQLILTTSVSEETTVETEYFEREFVDISKFTDYNENDLFHFGLTPIYRVNEDDYTIRYALMDKKGRPASAFEYEQICGFSKEGIAAFRQNDLWGFTDVNGNVLVEPQFTNVGIELGGLCCTIFYEGLIGVCNEDGYWGFMNTDGKIVIPCKYTMPDDEVPRFKNGFALVYNDLLHAGYVDKKGAEIGFHYVYAEEFTDNGYAIVGNGEDDEMKYGVIDKSGKVIIPLRYTYVTPFSDEGYAIAADPPEKSDEPQKEYELYSTDGTSEEMSVGWREPLLIVSPPEQKQFEKLLYCRSMQMYKRGDYYGIKDFKGNVILEPQYECIYDIDPEELPENIICVLERFQKRYTFDVNGEIEQFTSGRMDDPDPSQQIMLELSGVEPYYTGGEEKKLSSLHKDGEVFADLSDLDTPKAALTSDGYLYIIGYKENYDGGYSTFRRLIDPNGKEIELPEHCTLEYNYIWGGY